MGVLDGGLDLDFEVFTHLFFQKGYLGPAEFDLCRRLYSQFRLYLPPPDLFIYLKVPLPVILERFSRRGRPLEIATPGDLQAVQDLLDHWTASIHPHSLIEIDASQDDPNFSCLLPKLANRIQAWSEAQ
jgi:deoxyadenosine/deoxycytidine kinase